MKKLTMTLSIIALVFAAGVSVYAQGGGPDAAKSRMLVAFNRAELSADQLQTLQSLTQATIDAGAVVQAAQDALQEFLSSYAGSADDFDAAFEAEQAKVQAAREAAFAVKVANSDVILDTLTANQFNVLENTLSGIMAEERAQDGGPGGRGADNADGDNADGNNNDGNRGPQGQDGNDDGPDGRGGPGGRGGNGGGGNLDILLEVIGEKIAAIS
jgi:hypothetical protein